VWSEALAEMSWTASKKKHVCIEGNSI
jgi:hypothetical protein